MEKIKQEFFQDVAVSVLLYECTTWTLMKCLEKKLYSHLLALLQIIQDKQGSLIISRLEVQIQAGTLVNVVYLFVLV